MSFATFTLRAAAALLCAAAPAAFAQGYFGASAGATNANIDCAGTTACDNNGNGGKVFGGVRLGGGLGIEGMAYSFGEATATVPIGSTPVQSSIKGSGYGLGVAYKLPLGPAWSATFRLGFASNKAKATASGNGLSGSTDESSTQPYTGFAFSWQFAPNVALDLGADFTKFKITGESYNARMVGAGITVSF